MRKAPVIKQKTGGGAGQETQHAISLKRGDSGTRLPSGMERFGQLPRRRRPVKRWRSIARRVRPLPSGSNGSPRLQSRIASAVSTDNGRSARNGHRRQPVRECPRLLRATSRATADRCSAGRHRRAPTVRPRPRSRSSARPQQMRAQARTASCPANQIASPSRRSTGTDRTAEAIRLRARASSRPLTPRGISSRCDLPVASARPGARRGSSSSSSRSRHQARRIGPSIGSLGGAHHVRHRAVEPRTARRAPAATAQRDVA